MTIPPITAPAPDAILVLVEMAELYERVARVIGSSKSSRLGAKYLERSAALRWAVERLTAIRSAPGKHLLHCPAHPHNAECICEAHEG